MGQFCFVLKPRRPVQPHPMHSYTVADFDFTLPPELIAQHPPTERGSSRLLDGSSAQPTGRQFQDLPQLLRAGDLLVLNDTRVIKARLLGHKASGGAVQALVERVLPGLDHEVWAHVRASKSPLPRTTIRFANAFDVQVLGRAGPEDSLFRLRFPSDPFALLEQHGHVPLPPYITHADSALDAERYQTVFAARPGAVAAPTASLHFDEAMLATLAARGVQRTTVTLHVGAGTFQPVRSENLAAHRLGVHLIPLAVHAVGRHPRHAGRWWPRGGRGHHGAEGPRVGGVALRGAADQHRCRATPCGCGAQHCRWPFGPSNRSSP
jgi:S-adenosylmethionine:tRNA ribosyltransferase-isomerase